MDEPNDVSIIFCKHENLVNLTGDITYHICTAINEVVPNQALGAQKIRAVWVIGIRTSQARETLLQTNIIVNNNEVKLYGDNPYDLKAKRIEGERVVFKDLPLWEHPSLITNYLKSLPQIGAFSEVFLSKARDNSNKSTAFLNGDRFIFTKLDPANPLPDRCMLGDYNCRIWYASKKAQCKRCLKYGHQTNDINVCPYYLETIPNNYILFKNGTFSNFDSTPVTLDSTTFPTSEHAYQWRACGEHKREDLATQILHARSPLVAKRIAEVIKCAAWNDKKNGVMKEVLIAKIASSNKFRDDLLNSGNKVIIEALPDPWWGCGLPYNIAVTTNPDYLPGKNNLGKLLMELRSEMRNDPLIHPFPASPINLTVAQDRSRHSKKSRLGVPSSRSVYGKKAVRSSVTPLIKSMFNKQSVKRKRAAKSPKHSGFTALQDTDTDHDESFVSISSTPSVSDITEQEELLYDKK